MEPDLCALNDHLMQTFVHMHWVTNLDPLNSIIYVNILGTQTWELYHETI